MTNEVSRIARKVQSNLRAIGVRSTITVKGGLTNLAGLIPPGRQASIDANGRRAPEAGRIVDHRRDRKRRRFRDGSANHGVL
jgi:hypothetical protein